jgi:hypothetical protein
VRRLPVKGLLIIHIVPPYIEFPPVKYGGTERVAHYLVTAQIKLRRVLEDYLGVDQINIKVLLVILQRIIYL